MWRRAGFRAANCIPLARHHLHISAANGTTRASKTGAIRHDHEAAPSSSKPNQLNKMKPSLHISSRFRSAGLALAVAVLSPALFAQEPVTSAAKAGDKAVDKTASKIEDYRSEPSELSKAEVKAALAQIDAELDHLDALIDAAPTPEQKAEAKARYVVLKERRNQLKKEFNHARYEAFKADLQTEKDKVSAWAKETFSTKPAASAAASATSATADATAVKIADYRVDSTEVNKAEARSALARLDADIDLLDAKIDAVMDPVRKSELKQRFRDLKDRRNELNREYRKARYDALVDDVKAEWDKLVH
jgi:hypothetical protein